MDFNGKVGRHPGRTAEELKARREYIADRAKKTIERSEKLIKESKILMDEIRESRASVRKELLEYVGNVAARRRLVEEL